MTWIIGATAAAVIVVIIIWIVCDLIAHNLMSRGWSEDEMTDWETWKQEGKE